MGYQEHVLRVKKHIQEVQGFQTYLSNCETNEFSSSAEMFIVAGDDTEHECADQEALDLDPTAAKDLNEIDGEEIAGHVTCGRDDKISVAILEESIVFCLAGREADCGEEDRLVEIETVEGHVE